MFNLLRKYRWKKRIRSHLAQFRQRFTEAEQEAILISLLVVANADEEFHREEQAYFQRIAETLGYPLEEDFVDRFLAVDRQEVFRVLNGLEDEQKRWYTITLLAMIHMDGKPLEIEFDHALHYLNKMGIDRSTFQQIVSEANIPGK